MTQVSEAREHPHATKASGQYPTSALSLQRMFRRREASTEEVTRALLRHIEAREPTVGAWQFLDPELALAGARNVKLSGPLAGIPIGVKDVFDTRDMPTTYGSPIYAGHQPKRDSSSVARLRDAGALLMGKTVTTEFAAVFEPGKTRNPFALDRSPGGSSSGSAAAVADGMVPLAIGTQTAGSVIRPAAYCGVYGFKPTFGSIGRTGVKPVSRTLDTVGLFGRSVEDLHLLHRVLFGLDREDEATSWTKVRPLHPLQPVVSPVRLAYVRTTNWRKAEPSTRQALDSAAGALSDAGAIVTEVILPSLFESLNAGSRVILEYELRTSLDSEYTHQRALLGPGLRATLERGESIKPDVYRRCVAIAHTCQRHLATLFRKHDAILTPATLGEAPPIATTGDPLFCRVWTLLGNPTVAVPGMTGPFGLPLGIQLVGDRYRDVPLLAVAKWVALTLSSITPPIGRPSPGDVAVASVQQL